MRKSRIIILCIIIISLYLSYSLFFNVINTDDKKEPFPDEEMPIYGEEEPTPPGNKRTIDAGRHILELKDESPHKLSVREWWYFNVFFNEPESDLKDWSMIISFNKMAKLDLRFIDRDNLFIILYDNVDESYHFGSIDKKRGTLEDKGPGVNIYFEKSWAKGQYPNWHVHAENVESSFIADLDFTADFLPVWVEGRSSNLVIGGYVAGDYYIPRCKVEGNIIWEGNEYKVSGIGYHDHVWETNIPRFISRGWDWFNLHFDNGWEMYISKFQLRAIRDAYAGSLTISPNNRNIVEFYKYKMTYVESANAKDLPSLIYPKKIHIEVEKEGMALELDISVYNTGEVVFKKSRIGLFEGPCHVTGTFSWSGHTVELNGYGMTEFTRVKYLLQRPRILQTIQSILQNIRFN
ncbi:MAG: hypothetical protein JSW06_08785 [Thermoplasmatales archaeon]|nr:MAG: hypothetical protein JSW06_08785 [Thermoplasmatales archaeon]